MTKFCFFPQSFTILRYSLGLIAMTAMLSMAVKGMSVVSKPLPHGVTWFLQSGYLVYLGIEINVRTSK